MGDVFWRDFLDRENDIRIPIFITATSLIILIVVGVLGKASFFTSFSKSDFYFGKFGEMPSLKNIEGSIVLLSADG